MELQNNRGLTPEEKTRLEKDFTYHSPSGDQSERYQIIRQYGMDLAGIVMRLCPDSRKKSLALTKIKEAVIWANAAIAIEEKD
jgi:hypothetical protein